MAIVVYDLLAYGDGSAGQVFLTPWLDVNANELLLLSVCTRRSSSAGTVTVAGFSPLLNFDSVHSLTWGPSARFRHTLLRGMPTAASSGQLTITIAGNSNTTLCYVMVRVSGVALGTNGAAALRSIAGATGGSGSAGAVPLPVFGDAANATFAVFGNDASSGMISAEVGYTQGTQSSMGYMQYRAQWIDSGDQLPSADTSVGGATLWSGIAVELVNASGVGMPGGSRSYGMVA